MTIKVSDLVKLKSLNGLKLIAGENGLDKPINTVCLADMEFDDGFIPDVNLFRNGSLVMTTTRQTRKNSKNVTGVLGQLIDLRASGVVLVSREGEVIDDSIIQFCNENDFPLLVIDSTEIYVENAVFEIMLAIQESSVSFSLEREIDLMLKEELPEKEVTRIVASINPDFYRNCVVSYIRAVDGGSGFSPGKVARNYANKRSESGVNVGLIAYYDGLIVITSMLKVKRDKRDEVIRDILQTADSTDGLVIAHSNEHVTMEEMDQAMRECYYAYVSARISDRDEMEYEDIGTYRFLIANRNDPEQIRFMQKYLKAMSKEQLESAITFVKCNGSFDDAAKVQNCHRNTVRYRVNKIKEKTNPDQSDFEFYENLATAIKIYLIANL